MDDFSITTATIDQAEEEILTHAMSDEALEAAAGTDRGAYFTVVSGWLIFWCC
jgi:hypothetical protein